MKNCKQRALEKARLQNSPPDFKKMKKKIEENSGSTLIWRKRKGELNVLSFEQANFLLLPFWGGGGGRGYSYICILGAVKRENKTDLNPQSQHMQ